MQWARADNLTTCYFTNQIDVSFSCLCPAIDNTFRHNIVKVVQSSLQIHLLIASWIHSYNDMTKYKILDQ